ncbi:hypothetical protein Zmor_000481 [Zophobas morio]|uniref:Uncharacterized protein n=1 Tax=Zophobas morio TaxID=2755281 RepID=A0AA38IWN0_9CUCU|nr:hypothetical protein Zmor_000481 [Zophobas morio]
MGKNPVCCIVWFICLWFSFMIAGIAAFFYVIFYPITVCISACTGFTDVLLKGIQLPHTCAQKMVNCEGC